MDPTNRSITQTKTQTLLQSLHVLPNTYYCGMEPNHYVYQPSNDGHIQQEYHQTETLAMLQSLHVFLNIYY
jgi:hypothetical protein